MTHRHRGHGAYRDRGSSRRRDPRVARTRAIVLDAARRLLVEEGTDAVTPLRVSKATGIARTTIYRHWPERADLLRDVLSMEDPEPDVVLSGETRADLIAVLTHMSARLGQRPGARMMAVMMERSGLRGETGGHHREMVRRRMDPLRQVLEAGVTAGRLASDLDINHAIAQLAGPPFFEGVLMRRKVTNSIIEDTVDTFLATHSV